MPLERLPLPSLLLNLRGHIVACNAAATALLKANADVLGHERGTLVVLPAAAWVDGQLSGFANGTRAAALAALAVPRPGRLPLTLLLRPWPAAHAGRPAVLASLCDPHAHVIDVDVVRALFGLTEAEAAVAASLAEGLSTAEIAAQRGIKLGSVQAQVKRLLAKTGMPRQAALASLLWRSVAVRPQALPPPQPGEKPLSGPP